MGMRLYSYWHSSAAYRVRIALNLKGLDYAVRPVSLLPGVSEQKGAAYRARNPQGLVPFLEDGDVAIGQSLAILEYLEEAYPEKPLLPAATGARARIRSFCSSIACDIHPLNNLRVLQYLRGELGQDETAVQNWYAHWIHEGFRAAETFASYRPDSKFVYGNQPTLADAFLVPQMYNARRFKVSLEAFPRLVAIDAHCTSLPEFAAAAPEKQPDAD